MLESAINEIKEALYAAEDICEDAQIAHVLAQCDFYFTQIASVYYTPLNKRVRENNTEIAKALGFPEDTFNIPNNENTRVAIGEIFPQFGSCPLENILHTDQPSVMEIFPYLLSSYYLNLHKGKQLSARTQEMLFPGSTDELSSRDGNYRRNVQTYLARFSCKDFLPDFLNAKRSREPKIKKLKSKSDISNYLKKGPMSQFHYVQLFKAFVYLSCAAICSLEFPDSINLKIDYKKSWELFDDHTLAFNAVCCVGDSPDYLDEEEQSYPFYSKLWLCHPDWKKILALYDYYLTSIEHLKIQEEYLGQILGGRETNHRLFSLILFRSPEIVMSKIYIEVMPLWELQYIIL